MNQILLNRENFFFQKSAVKIVAITLDFARESGSGRFLMIVLSMRECSARLTSGLIVDDAA